MLILFPSQTDTGTLSPIFRSFETSPYYTIAEIIDGTLATTYIKKGFASPPPEGRWPEILRKQRVVCVVADEITDRVAAMISGAGIRVIPGVRGLIGDVTDWIADEGLEEFERRVTAEREAASRKLQAAKAPPVTVAQGKITADQVASEKGKGAEESTAAEAKKA